MAGYPFIYGEYDNAGAEMRRYVVFMIAMSMPMLPSGGAVAAGDAVNGEKLFKRCAACHTAGEGGANRVGPNLFGVYGSTAGSRAAGFRYSPALAGSGIVWDDEALDAWLASPRKFVAGTRMAFPGLTAADDRADVISYLKTLTK